MNRNCHLFLSPTIPDLLECYFNRLDSVPPPHLQHTPNTSELLEARIASTYTQKTQVAQAFSSFHVLSKPIMISSFMPYVTKRAIKMISKVFLLLHIQSTLKASTLTQRQTMNNAIANPTIHPVYLQ